MLRRLDLHLQDKHWWFEVEQKTVTRFLLGATMEEVPIPLPLIKEHPQEYTESEMLAFKSHGSFLYGAPESRAKWPIRPGGIKI